MATVEVAVSLRDGSPEDADALAAMEVTELVVVDSPPAHSGPLRPSRSLGHLPGRAVACQTADRLGISRGEDHSTAG